MLTRTVLFQPVTRKQTVAYTCTRCGKKRSKVVKTEHTINPFNINAAGVPKSREEVLESVRLEQARKIAEIQAGEKCNKCKDEIVAERKVSGATPNTEAPHDE